MNTCDTCRHWGKADNEPRVFGQNKVCMHVIRSGGVPYEQSVSPMHDNNYLSDLFTGPKFGCIHHS